MERESWLRTAWAIIVEIAEFIVKLAQAGLKILGAEQVEFNPAYGSLMLLVFTVMLGSGCWAASIALSRRHSGWLHFLLGFFLPVLYPVVILFAMNLKGESKRRKHLAAKNRQKEEQEIERQKMFELQGIGPSEPEQAEVEEKVWNQRYFERLAITDTGTPAGPWNVVVAGHAFVVLQILEAQESVVLVETGGREGGTQKLRIPYSKIESWQDG